MKTIMEALGGNKGETIMETLGGKKGETIADVIEETGLTPVTPEPAVKYTVTYNANGGSGTIESVEVTAGESITLNDGSGLTAPEGKEFLGWAKTDSAQSATVTSPFTPDKDTILYAVWGNVTPGE
jgi:hypothetical protein